MTSGSRKNRDSRKTHNKRRRYYHYHGVKAAEVAIARSGLAKKILILSFCLKSLTIFQDQEFWCNVIGLRTVGALDVRNQCSGFICLVCC
jgi:hypothetical protein